MIRKTAINLLVIVLSTTITLCLLEGGVRLYHRVRFDVPLLGGPAGGTPPARGPLSSHAEYGWHATPGYRSTAQRTSLDGSTYTADISFDERGFRVFGDIETRRRRIFVVGDSFTQAIHVSDGRTYYEILGRQLDREVFAYGAGGYGTLQEFLVFREYFGEIRPDLVLWQLATNDCINNLAALEARSLLNNNRMKRPFWEDGRIVHRMADLTALRLDELGLQGSRFLTLLMNRWDRYASGRAGESGNSVEFEIEERGEDHPMLRRSAGIVTELLTLARRHAGDVPIVTFLADHRGTGGEPYASVLRQASLEAGVRHVSGVGEAIAAADREGQVVYYRDGAHWNERGHELAAGLLTESISP